MNSCSLCNQKLIESHLEDNPYMDIIMFSCIKKSLNNINHFELIIQNIKNTGYIYYHEMNIENHHLMIINSNILMHSAAGVTKMPVFEFNDEEEFIEKFNKYKIFL